MDHLNRIVAIVPVRVPTIKLSSDANVIVGNTGAVMMRVGRLHRFEMPEWLIIRQKLEQYKSFTGPLTLTSKPGDKPWAYCVVCSAAVYHGMDPLPRASSSDVYACSQCCSVWHESCAQAYAAAIGHHRVPADASDVFTCGYCC